MESCVFCKIIAGELPAAKVYEDEYVLVFMTVEATNEGHALVIPKMHVPNFEDMSQEIYDKVFTAVRRTAQAIKQTYTPEKVGLSITGWEVPHTHIHVLPLYKTTDIISKQKLDNIMLTPSLDERTVQAEKIKQNWS